MRELLEPIWPLYSAFRAIVILLDITLLFLGLYAATQVFSYRPKFVHDPRKPSKKKAVPRATRFPTLVEHWKKIQQKLAAESADLARLAVIEADGLTDSVLKKLKYEGETFADRLIKISADDVPAVDGVWAAHRVRNDLVHTPGFKITPERARELVDNYEAFLKALKVFPAPRGKETPKPAPIVVPTDE